ncbi:MAG: TIGR02466 family protein [Alphaproteobacteria bacterium]
MFVNRTMEAAFASCIWQQELADCAAFNEALVNRIAKIPNKIWHQNSWQSDDDLHTLPEFADFNAMVLDGSRHVLTFLKMQYEDLYITGCWANLNGKDGITPQHTHPNNYLSGVYYVVVPDNCGNLKFSDPRPQASIVAPVPREFTQFNSGTLFVHPKVGKLVLFQSWLPHAVLPNNNTEIRISIAFNVMFRGAIGSYGQRGQF